MIQSRQRSPVKIHLFERDNGNVHRAAANIIVSKSRAARGSVCNVLLSDVRICGDRFDTYACALAGVTDKFAVLHRQSQAVFLFPSTIRIEKDVVIVSSAISGYDCRNDTVMLADVVTIYMVQIIISEPNLVVRFAEGHFSNVMHCRP